MDSNNNGQSSPGDGSKDTTSTVTGSVPAELFTPQVIAFLENLRPALTQALKSATPDTTLAPTSQTTTEAGEDGQSPAPILEGALSTIEDRLRAQEEKFEAFRAKEEEYDKKALERFAELEAANEAEDRRLKQEANAKVLREAESSQQIHGLKDRLISLEAFKGASEERVADLELEVGAIPAEVQYLRSEVLDHKLGDNGS